MRLTCRVVILYSIKGKNSLYLYMVIVYVMKGGLGTFTTKTKGFLRMLTVEVINTDNDSTY